MNSLLSAEPGELWSYGLGRERAARVPLIVPLLYLGNSSVRHRQASQTLAVFRFEGRIVAHFGRLNMNDWQVHMPEALSEPVPHGSAGIDELTS
jgi:hypothetical protein